jgi:hypothetical protein
MLAGGITVVFTALVFWFIVIIYRSYAHEKRGFSRPTRKSYLVLDEDKTSHQTDSSSAGDSKHQRMKSERSKAKGIGSRAKQFTKKLASKTSAILKSKKRTSVVKSVGMTDLVSPSSNERPQTKDRFARLFVSSSASGRHHHEMLRDIDDDAEGLQRLSGPRGYADEEDEDLEEIILNEAESDSYRVINKEVVASPSRAAATPSRASHVASPTSDRQQRPGPSPSVSTDVHGNEEEEEEEEEVTLMLNADTPYTASQATSPAQGPSSSRLDDAASLVSLTGDGRGMDEDEEIDV